ncbi:MAG: UDP-N-acetylglucosamine--N-acetylmuramyl-(pentapeptide) pyrophosphoryl-undecaprenol N-acetylglucosamine transferase [Solirubrobacterales bacterium]
MPALAVADALRAEGASVSFLGTRDRAEARLVPEAGYEIDFLEVTGLHRRNPLRAARSLAQAGRALGVARRLLDERETDVVMGGGGYVAGPAGFAAVRSGRPLILTEADSHLGLANRALARWARRICLAFPLDGRDGSRYRVTGRPVPRAVLDAPREPARRRFGVEGDRPCLLVFGGSLGARTINEAALEGLGSDPDRHAHVVHIAGRRDYPDLQRRHAEIDPDRYTLLEYEPHLGDALAASDLVLARSGGSIFEVTARGRPAILVPYPHATADHQSHNAQWMADAGAATVIADADLDGDRLRSEVAGILETEGRLAQMAQASARLSQPHAAREIAGEVLAAAQGAAA